MAVFRLVRNNNPVALQQNCILILSQTHREKETEFILHERSEALSVSSMLKRLISELKGILKAHQISSSQYALLLSVKAEQMFKSKVISCVFLLNIKIRIKRWLVLKSRACG